SNSSAAPRRSPFSSHARAQAKRRSAIRLPDERKRVDRVFAPVMVLPMRQRKAFCQHSPQFPYWLIMMRAEDILVPTPAGVCCKRGGFHIDPVRAVERAVITHGHSDHARAGHGAVLATRETLDIMRLRYGTDFAGSTQAVGYGETVSLGGAQVTLY